ncbi:MAG TPA: hypothetical protein P5300_07580 [Acidobacteriota bacterium]|nr:hypothetical protein [Acidobacteriota bacterium]
MNLLTLVPVWEPAIPTCSSTSPWSCRVTCTVRTRVLGVPLDPHRYLEVRRRQYHSTPLLSELLRLIEPGKGEVVLGITEHDLFIPILTFVFGEAVLGGRAAVVSAHRLRQERYGLPRTGRPFWKERRRRHCTSWGIP